MSVVRTPSSSGTTAVGSSRSAYLRLARDLMLRGGSRILSTVAKRGGKHLMNQITKKAKKANSKSTGGNETSRSDRAAKVINRRNPRVSIKPKKKVTISKNFKAKVTKALEPMKMRGRYQETSVYNQNFPLAYGNKQIYGRFAPNIGSAGRHALFSPLDILDNASVLFNNRAATQTKGTASGFTTDFGSDSLDARIVKVNVIYQKFHLTLRNNSKRTWIIQLYEASPKKAFNCIEDGDVVTQWENCMINEGSTDTDVTKKRINMLPTTPSTLYCTPKDSKFFMSKWNIEKHDIILDPGQVYDHVMIGPTGEYDFSKFWRQDSLASASEFLNYQPKFTRECFYTARLDLIAGTNGDGGRWGIPAEDKAGLVHEMTKYTMLSVPDLAGGVLFENNSVISGTKFNLTQQRDCYFKHHWNEGVQAPLVRVDVQSGENNLD